MPTQIGSTAELFGSRRMMIGIWVMGSIINPLIFISSSIEVLGEPIVIRARATESCESGLL
jgi:hypothetical protein